MPTNAKDFRKHVLRLRNANPEAFDQFINYFATYTEESLIAVSEADAVNIMTMKGRAQQCRALLQLFVTCDQEVRQAAPIPE